MLPEGAGGTPAAAWASGGAFAVPFRSARKHVPLRYLLVQRPPKGTTYTAAFPGIASTTWTTCSFMAAGCLGSSFCCVRTCENNAVPAQGRHTTTVSTRNFFGMYPGAMRMTLSTCLRCSTVSM